MSHGASTRRMGWTQPPFSNHCFNDNDDDKSTLYTPPLVQIIKCTYIHICYLQALCYSLVFCASFKIIFNLTGTSSQQEMASTFHEHIGSVLANKCHTEARFPSEMMKQHLTIKNPQQNMKPEPLKTCKNTQTCTELSTSEKHKNLSLIT